MVVSAAPGIDLPPGAGCISRSETSHFGAVQPGRKDGTQGLGHILSRIKPADDDQVRAELIEGAFRGPGIGPRSLRKARQQRGVRASSNHRGSRMAHGLTVTQARQAERRLAQADGARLPPPATRPSSGRRTTRPTIRRLGGRSGLPRISVIVTAMRATLVGLSCPLPHETTFCLDMRHCRETCCARPAGLPWLGPSEWREFAETRQPQSHPTPTERPGCPESVPPVLTACSSYTSPETQQSGSPTRSFPSGLRLMQSSSAATSGDDAGVGIGTDTVITRRFQADPEVTLAGGCQSALIFCGYPMLE
jgi:hypothetical protein